jgi:hypothetical protein
MVYVPTPKRRSGRLQWHPDECLSNRTKQLWSDQTEIKSCGVMEISTEISKEGFRKHTEMPGRSCQSEQWDKAWWSSNQSPREQSNW